MHYRLILCSCLLLTSISLQSHAETIEVVTEDSLYAYQRDDKVVGPGIRIAEETLKNAQLTDYSLSLYPWARAYEKALHEPNVLIFPLDRTPAREQLFKWVGEIHRVASRLYKMRDSEGIVVNNLEDAKQYSIGVVRNDAKQIYLQQRGLTRLVISANNHDNFQKLLNHQIQMLPMPENTARLMSKDAQVDFYFAGRGLYPRRATPQGPPGVQPGAHLTKSSPRPSALSSSSRLPVKWRES